MAPGYPVDDEKQLVITILPPSATNKSVVWASSNTAVATVSQTGLVTRVGLGTAVITATTNDGGFVASCNIAVYRKVMIVAQPQNIVEVEEGDISEVLSVAAIASQDGTPTYQWYSNTTDSNTGGAAISGATSASFTIPTNLTEGIYYYYCVASSENALPVASEIATVVVSEAYVPVTGIEVSPDSWTWTI